MARVIVKMSFKKMILCRGFTNSPIDIHKYSLELNVITFIKKIKKNKKIKKIKIHEYKKTFFFFIVLMNCIYKMKF